MGRKLQSHSSVLFDYLRKTVNFMVCMKLLDIKRLLKSSVSAFSHY